MTTESVSREDFFRDILVPTGTIAEVLSHLLTESFCPSDELEKLRSGLWVPLDMVALHVPCTPDTAHFPRLRKAVLRYRDQLVEALREFPWRTLPLQLRSQAIYKPAQALYLLMGAARPDTDWTANIAQPTFLKKSLPVELQIDETAWRTFSRHLEGGKILHELGLSTFTRLAAKLSTVAGQEKAQTLWDKCFPPANPTPEATVATGATAFPGPAIPQNVAVVQLPSGFFEVTAVIDPKRSLTTSAEGLANMPASLASQLGVQRKVVHCAYTRLADAVLECNSWLDTHRSQTADLQAQYDQFIEGQEAATVMDKFTAQFSPEEIAVIRRQMARQESLATA